MRYFAEDSYYHIVCRGNNKENVFTNKGDYVRYLTLLKKYQEKYALKILVFALMPNHIHILLQQKTDLPISKFMQSLNTAYAMYFNLRHKHFGHLFQGKFKYIEVNSDEYLVHVSRYIHLNPSSAGLVRNPENYQWGSYRHYLGLDNMTFVDKKIILDYFSSKGPSKDYKEFVESRIDYQKEISIQKALLE